MNDAVKKRNPPTVAEVLARQGADAERTAVARPASNPWLTVAGALGQHVGLTSRLKFTKQGEFSVSDDETLPPGTRCIARVDRLTFGWVKWVGNQPVERRNGPVADGYAPPPRAELGDLDESAWEVQADGSRRDPWQFTAQLPLTRLDNRVTYEFSTSSRGGLEAIGRLARAYGERVDEHPGSLPIVELQPSSYKHRAYGRIFKPALHVVGWTDGAGAPLSTTAELDDAIPF